MLYQIAEIFESVQGEGSFVGAPSLFIRFAGCNMACEWCDTDHTVQMELGHTELTSIISSSKMPHVVLTGGEPTLQDLDLPAMVVGCLGKTIQIETNGTINLPIPSGPHIFVTVSPKDYDFERRVGHELKVVWDGSIDVERLRVGTTFNHYFLQPLWSGDSSNVGDVIEYISMAPHWRLSVQTHKYIGVR